MVNLNHKMTSSLSIQELRHRFHRIELSVLPYDTRVDYRVGFEEWVKYYGDNSNKPEFQAGLLLYMKGAIQIIEAEVAEKLGDRDNGRERLHKRRRINDGVGGASTYELELYPSIELKDKEKAGEEGQDGASIGLKLDSSNSVDVETGNGPSKKLDHLPEACGGLLFEVLGTDFNHARKEFRDRLLALRMWNGRSTKECPCWTKHEANSLAHYVFGTMLDQLQPHLLQFRVPYSSLPLGRRVKDIIQRARSAVDERGVPPPIIKFFQDFTKCIELPLPAFKLHASEHWQRYRLVQQLHEYQLFDTHRQLIQQVRTPEIQTFLIAEGFRADAHEDWRAVLERYLNDKLQLRGRHRVDIMCKRGLPFDGLVKELGEGALGFLPADSFEMLNRWEGPGLDMAWQELTAVLPTLDDFAGMMEANLIGPLRRGTLKVEDVEDAESLSAQEVLMQVFRGDDGS